MCAKRILILLLALGFLSLPAKSYGRPSEPDIPAPPQAKLIMDSSQDRFGTGLKFWQYESVLPRNQLSAYYETILKGQGLKLTTTQSNGPFRNAETINLNFSRKDYFIAIMLTAHPLNPQLTLINIRAGPPPAQVKPKLTLSQEDRSEAVEGVPLPEGTRRLATGSEGKRKGASYVSPLAPRGVRDFYLKNMPGWRLIKQVSPTLDNRRIPGRKDYYLLIFEKDKERLVVTINQNNIFEGNYRSIIAIDRIIK